MPNELATAPELSISKLILLNALCLCVKPQSSLASFFGKHHFQFDNACWLKCKGLHSNDIGIDEEGLGEEKEKA